MHRGHRVSIIAEPPSGDKPRLIVVCGPTAVGKTTVGIELARALGGEIISADSMQVYRHMDIGTAKPTAAEQAAVPHHLIDVVDPDEPFDAATYAAQGRQAVAALSQRGRTPVVVGGTGLYVKALLSGLFRSEARDPVVRSRLRAEVESLGPVALYVQLERCDPQTAARLHPNDAVRILRALEVFEVTGRPISELQQEHRFAHTPFCVLKIGLSIDRPTLYERINRRVDAMAAAGLEQEVRSLLARGYGPELRAMQSIGYSHMTRFIAGSFTWEECIRTLKRDTRRFAKRQMTWFRADAEIAWSSPDRLPDLIRRSKEFLRIA
jgi:tRNA dimethylallyltransferase